MLHVILILIAGTWANPIWDNLDSGKPDARERIIKQAEHLLNSPYRYGGNTAAGFDCSGLTQYVFTKAGNIRLPRSSSAQFREGKKVKLKDCSPGDLVFFSHSGKIGHVGIIHRKNRKGIWMIHSSSSRGVISEEITRSAYWNQRIRGVKRLLES